MFPKEDQNPIDVFASWFEEAKKSSIPDATAVALATSTKEGFPSVRMVLLKDFNKDGFVFYTNFKSRKGKELLENPKASICFYWEAVGKQVRIEGLVEQVSDEEANKYFATRSRGSQIGAWASRQSEPLDGTKILLAKIAKKTAAFGIGTIPRPPFWSGFRIKPIRIEFWQQGEFRIHKRLQYNKEEGGEWSGIKLYP